MESKIPLPTDNIYKFYALFGLALIVSSMLAIVYLQKTTNDLIFTTAFEYEELVAKEHLSVTESKRKEIFEKKLEIAVADKKYYSYALGGILGLGLVLSWVGFTKWQKEIQPKQDKLLDLQIAKAEEDLKPATRKPFRATKRANHAD